MYIRKCVDAIFVKATIFVRCVCPLPLLGPRSRFGDKLLRISRLGENRFLKFVPGGVLSLSHHPGVIVPYGTHVHTMYIVYTYQGTGAWRYHHASKKHNHDRCHARLLQQPVVVHIIHPATVSYLRTYVRTYRRSCALYGSHTTTRWAVNISYNIRSYLSALKYLDHTVGMICTWSVCLSEVV